MDKIIETMDKILVKIAYGLALLYIWVAFFIFVPYYNWQFAKTHDFSDWIFFGEVVPTIQALGWPYFVIEPFLNPRGSDVTEENLPKLRLMLIGMLEKQCLDKFTAKANWTARVHVSSEEFCSCTSKGTFSEMKIEDVRRVVKNEAPTEADNYNAMAIMRICSGEEK